MYLFYVDESGVLRGWTEQDNYILAGVAIHEGQVRHFSQALDDIQESYFPTISVPMELHAQHIAKGKGRFRKLTKEERAALLDAAYSVFENAYFPNLICFVTAIHLSAVGTPQQAFRNCLEDIAQRFNTFLVRQFKAGHPDKGLLIMDRSGRDQQVRDLLAEFSRHGTSHGYLGNIVDVPYFASSSSTRMLQLADLLAYAGHRYFNHNDLTYLNRVIGRIDRRSPKGDRVGLKHIIGKSHNCSCIALH